MCTARRRGAANALAPSASKPIPSLPRPSRTPARKASASSSRALGGSSSVPNSTSNDLVSSAMGLLLLAQAREAEFLALCHIGFGDAAGQCAHAQDVALALGHADRASRIKQVEGVAGLAHLLIGRQRQAHFDELGGFALAH